MLDNAKNNHFDTTRWTLLDRFANGSDIESRDALNVICQCYWRPLYAYARRVGSSPDDAKDLVQSFFTALVDGEWLKRAEAEKGKLRTFLLTLLNRHVASEWRKLYSQKRGGGTPHVSFDELSAEEWYSRSDPSISSEAMFDRQWALTVLEQCMHRMQEDFQRRGMDDRFEVLKRHLAWTAPDDDENTYEEDSARLNASVGTVKVAVFRMRKQFRELVISEVKQTLGDVPQGEVDQELRYLMQALGNQGR